MSILDTFILTSHLAFERNNSYFFRPNKFFVLRQFFFYVLRVMTKQPFFNIVNIVKYQFRSYQLWWFFLKNILAFTTPHHHGQRLYILTSFSQLIRSVFNYHYIFFNFRMTSCTTRSKLCINCSEFFFDVHVRALFKKVNSTCILLNIFIIILQSYMKASMSIMVSEKGKGAANIYHLDPLVLLL